jgi:hypothetical protein
VTVALLLLLVVLYGVGVVWAAYRAFSRFRQEGREGLALLASALVLLIGVAIALGTSRLVNAWLERTFTHGK